MKLTEQRIFVYSGLLAMDLAAFLAAVAYLPRNDSAAESGGWSSLISSRNHWEIPWIVLLAAVLLSVGVALLLQGFGKFQQPRRDNRPPNPRPQRQHDSEERSDGFQGNRNRRQDRWRPRQPRRQDGRPPSPSQE
jgi:hypothetical protein